MAGYGRRGAAGSDRRARQRTSTAAPLIAALHCRFYGDWVPSKANPADVPTRAERAHEVPSSATWVQMILPALEAVERNVGAWIREVRAHVGQSRAAQRD